MFTKRPAMTPPVQRKVEVLPALIRVMTAHLEMGSGGMFLEWYDGLQREAKFINVTPPHPPSPRHDLGLLFPLFSRPFPILISAPSSLSAQQSPLLVTLTDMTTNALRRSSRHQGSASAPAVWLQEPLVYKESRLPSMALEAPEKESVDD